MALAALVAVPARAETEFVVAAYPPLDESVKLAIPRFERLHPDIRIKLRTLPFGDHHNAMITALASGTGLPDVMAVELSFIGRFTVSKDALVDLGAPPYDGKRLLEKLLPFARSQASSGSKSLATMPVDVGPGTLFYRKDLLDAAGVTEEELTRSWESYIEAGKKIRAATGAYLLAHAAEIKDVYLRANVRDGEPIYFDRPNSRWPAFTSPRFQRAFTLAKLARDAGVDAKVGAWSNEWAEGLRSGRIASVMMGSWLAGHMSNWIAPDTKGLWRAAQLPGGAFTTWGGSFFAIPAKVEHKAEAWAFIRFMCFDREQQLQAYRRLDAWPALLAAQEDPSLDRPVPFLGGQRAGRLWKQAAIKAPAPFVHPFDPVAADVVNGELEQVLEKGKPVEQALGDAFQQASCRPGTRGCR